MTNKTTVFRAIWGVSALLLASCLLFLCFRGVDFGQLAAASRDIRLSLVFAAVVSAALTLVVSALEWKLFLPPKSSVPTVSLLKLAAVMLMLQNTLHHFAGQAFFVLQLGRRENLSRPARLSVLAQDQIAEGFARLLLFGALALAAAVPAWATGGIEGLAVSVMICYAAALVFAWRHRNFDERQLNRSSGWSWLVQGFARWAHHLRGLRDARITLLAVLMAFSKKCLKAAAVACVQSSLSIDLPFYTPFLVVAVLDLATMISIAPGHVGVFEATISFTYRYLGVDPERALLLALVYHAAFLAAMVVPGLFVTLAGALDRALQRRGATESPWTGGRLVEQVIAEGVLAEGVPDDGN